MNARRATSEKGETREKFLRAPRVVQDALFALTYASNG